MKSISVWMFAAVMLCVAAQSAQAQEKAARATPEKLPDLLAEAEANNPRIQIAKQEWQSMQKMPTQLATLPDPQVTLQQVNVGSPRPFAGFSNSDFAYIGLGVSQDLPYPGKVRLRGELAGKDADVAAQKIEAVRKEVFSELKMAYFRIAFLAKQSSLLQGNRELLGQMEQAAEAKYRSGMGNQQEVLQAQLERTKLLREITGNDLDTTKAESELKRLLGRPQTSPDVPAEEIAESAVAQSYDELVSAALADNPHILGAKKTVDRQRIAIELAKKDFYPDFNVQFVWQRTDPTQFRAYYQFTVGARIPIYRKRKLQPELAQAEIDKGRAQSELGARSQEVASALRQQYLTAGKSSELLRIYREGLLPQAKAELQAGFAAYQSNRQDFQALLASFLDLLKIQEEYWQSLAEHENAWAQIEELTGLSLRTAAGARQ